MKQAGVALDQAAQLRLDSLSKQNTWKLATNESDEFPFWMGSGMSDDSEPWEQYASIPRTRRGILQYLLAHPTSEELRRDSWRKLCSERFQATAYALYKLSQQSSWPADRWRDALQAWSEEKLHDRSWHYMAPVVANAPDDLIQTLSHSVSWWLQVIAKTFNGHLEHFLALVKRILVADFEDESDTDDPVFRAINHPIGHVTQALLDWWYRHEPNDGEGLPETVSSLFTEICDVKIAKFQHGRVLLSAHALSLFRVDPSWSIKHLLPLFDWRLSKIEARSAWEGFLWSPRLYRPLMEAIRPVFLDTANHYNELGKHSAQFAAFLTFAALDPGDTFSVSQLATAIRSLPSDGLHESADALARALEGAGDQREDYWRNRVYPFWMKIWPKSNEQAANANTEALARVCIAAGNEFPSAMVAIGNWLQPVQHPDHIIRLLLESGLTERFPDEALRLLSSILSDQPLWLSAELRKCLNAIGHVKPFLQKDHKFMRIDELARRFNI
ncbi:MAG TPA: hypothetical protein VE092_13345 [Herbaspirillum sp.]|uniref:hypothetical protein n=1 Tax=Herbaspirillum sp. TaxID=1890675 RepID=UPI002D3660E9|nr:hypothetical protein [Herbaspirillum sp.]HZG20998.1 hypothetical protein [Herbaspirillum sp.]